MRFITVCVALMLAVQASAATFGDIVMVPDIIQVDQAGTFDVAFRLQTITPGLKYNGFEITVAFDPAALDSVPMPAAWEYANAAIYTEPCSWSGGGHFHDRRYCSTRREVAFVKMCNGWSWNQPGELYRMRFRAKPGFVGITYLHFVRYEKPNCLTPTGWQNAIRTAFYDAGTTYYPTSMTDAVVAVGTVPAAGVQPGPSASPAGGKMYDLQGRRIQHAKPGEVVFQNGRKTAVVR